VNYRIFNEIIVFIFVLITFPTISLSELHFCMFYSYVPLIVSYGFVIFEVILIIVYTYTTTHYSIYLHYIVQLNSFYIKSNQTIFFIFILNTVTN